MHSAAILRRQIEDSLGHRIPSALTPAPRIMHPVVPTGVQAIDDLLDGGLPSGAITEVVGPECSGRSGFAIAFVAGLTQAAKVCAWIDVSDAFDPESAAAAGVDLSRLLWVRCGAKIESRNQNRQFAQTRKPGTRIEQAIRVTDLILQGGGFSAVVLDMGSIAPEYASRVPQAAWFRYRAAAEQMQASILLLTQSSCAKSSADLLLHLQPGAALQDEGTLFTGMDHCIEVGRRRFTSPTDNVITLRKPPQHATRANWQSRVSWAGPVSEAE